MSSNVIDCAVAFPSHFLLRFRTPKSDRGWEMEEGRNGSERGCWNGLGQGMIVCPLGIRGRHPGVLLVEVEIRDSNPSILESTEATGNFSVP